MSGAPLDFADSGLGQCVIPGFAQTLCLARLPLGHQFGQPLQLRVGVMRALWDYAFIAGQSDLASPAGLATVEPLAGLARPRREASPRNF